METIYIIVLLALILALAIFLVVKITWMQKTPGISTDLERMERMNREDAKDLRQELGQNLLSFSDSIRKTVEERLDKINAENAVKLDQMRATVDEKLNTTLEKRLGESFSQVSERLAQVHKGIGEMQTLANDVGGLKRILANVKTRGTWGEVQLGSLLEQILSPEQYIKNAKIKDDTTEVVEYAVCLPDGLIPIDSKFPIESFERLVLASERADPAAIELASTELERAIKLQAKTISEKYIQPPKTINYAIMFLPTEGLYAEIMKRGGLVNELQNKFRVSVTGPSTLAALLNSLQMGFKTLAIQKRSGEVWQVLNEVKTEFEKYAEWVEEVKNKLDAAHKSLDKADTRTRAVNRKLRGVESHLEVAGTSALPSLAKMDEE